MEPIRITAHLQGAIAMHTPIAIDALLCYAACAAEGRSPPLTLRDCTRASIPIEEEPEKRFHLCSTAFGEAEIHEHRWINRKFPLAEAQMLAETKFTRILIAGGPCKSFRLPLDTAHMVEDRLHWWAIGDRSEVAELLSLVGYLGKRRAVGLGKVIKWEVESCETWGEGFPVVRDGQPMRPLPTDWPGLRGHLKLRYSNFTFPYWNHAGETLCAVPIQQERTA